MNSYDVGGVRLPRPFKIRRLGHTGLNVSSFDKVIDFYSRILGFRVTDSIDAKTIPGLPESVRAVEDGRGVFLTYGSDHHAFFIFHKSAAHVFGGQPLPGITLNQITWQVSTLSEVVEATKFLADQGTEIERTGRDMPGSNWAVYFKGPDGHTNEIYYGIEQIGWDRKSKPAAMNVGFTGMIVLPQRPESLQIVDAEACGVDIDSGHRIAAPQSPAYTVGGVLLERPFKVIRLGPMRLFVPSVDETAAFYRDILGFTETEQVVFDGMRCVFLRAGSEHHSLALCPLALRERLGFSGHSRCMSIGLQVGSYSQLRDALRFFGEQGCKIIDFPAELHPGIDYTVNVLDPEGHCIQLYYYMEQIGWDGLPRPANLRRAPNSNWPESIDPQSDTFDDSAFQGPLD
jgi:catechol 2,3-dioxygenase-like lactoylglutathione lyase family enzyme